MPFTGPRNQGGSRHSSITNNNFASRGGIQKHRGGGPRFDKDGDSGGDRGHGGSSRSRGARGRGGGDLNRGGGWKQPGYQKGTFSGKGKNAWQQLSVSGLKESKVSSDQDGGEKSLVTFLERKVNLPNKNPKTYRKIKQSRMEGDLLIISVSPEDVSHYLKCNGMAFASTSLVIEKRHNSRSSQHESIDFDLSRIPQWALEMLEEVITRRYVADQRLLDLSALAGDMTTAAKGFFNRMETAPKFFPALLKGATKRFKSVHAKRDGVLSVLLSGNELSDLTWVKDLSLMFPDIRNLDLSNNKFPDLRALEVWRWKFRSLEHVIVSSNPLEATVPDYKDQLTRWYPALRMVNAQQVRSDEELKALAEQRAFVTEGSLPIPIKLGSFQDENEIGRKFIELFFPNYDSNRGGLLSSFYDDRSTFSFAVNISAPRSPMYQQKQVSFDAYIKGSRNLKRLSNHQARAQRLYTGGGNIASCWATLPVTRHLDLKSMHNRWMTECHPIPGQVDVSGANPGGVGGLIITVHSEFDEVNVATGEPTETRSFDRTFVLGPSLIPGGIRVASDMLTLRAYGGIDAFVAQEAALGGMTDEMDPMSTDVEIKHLLPGLQPIVSPTIPDFFGKPRPGMTPDQVEMEAMVVAFSRRTLMTLEYSNMCLEENNWNVEAAYTAFEEVKDKLPREAWP